MSHLKIRTIFHTDVWKFDFDGAIDSSADDFAEVAIRVVHLRRESRLQTEISLRVFQR